MHTAALALSWKAYGVTGTGAAKVAHGARSFKARVRAAPIESTATHRAAEGHDTSVKAIPP